MELTALVRHIEAMIKLKNTNMDTKKDVLINLLVSYINNPAVAAAAWRAGFSLSQTLKDAVAASEGTVVTSEPAPVPLRTNAPPRSTMPPRRMR